MSNNKVELGLYITGSEYMKTFRVIRDMVEKLLPNGEIRVTTPDMQALERVVAEKDAEIERLKSRNKKECPRCEFWDRLPSDTLKDEQTIATQKRVIAILKEQRNVAHERARVSADEMMQFIQEDDAEIAAIEKVEA